MLTIRKEQMRALAEEQDKAFVVDMAAHLRRHFAPELVDLDVPQLHARIREALHDGRAYHLQTRQDLCQFLHLCCCFGWDFDRQARHAWMRDGLLDARVSTPSDRLHVLVGEAVADLKTEAELDTVYREFVDKSGAEANA